MSITDDFIEFDSSSDWERVIGLTFTAQPVGQDSYIPIGQKDLGIAITEPYLVIVVQPVNGKPTWRYGGEVRQTWEFPSGGATGTNFSRAQSKPVQLFVNKPQLVGFNRNTTDTYRVYYDPPTWFKQVIVIGWKYTGNIRNFVIDTLFDIGNQVGAGTFTTPTSITSLLAQQQRILEDIEARLEEIENNNNPSNSVPLNDEAIGQISNSVSQNISSVNQRIDRLSNNLSDVLSGDSDPDLLAQNNDRTIIEDELI